MFFKLYYPYRGIGSKITISFLFFKRILLSFLMICTQKQNLYYWFETYCYNIENIENIH